jgi:predicted ATPase/class 3 adenylate cyclase/DNA-binding CsgD family transcriptional regulator
VISDGDAVDPVAETDVGRRRERPLRVLRSSAASPSGGGVEMHRPLSQDVAVSLPSGTVTFLLTDIEGSTRRWETAAEAMAQAVPRHYELIAAAIEGHHGVRPVEQGEGDSVVGVFTRASDALHAAVDLQLALLVEPWPDGIDLSVRVALHAADAQLRDAGNYQGVALSRCARLRAIAAGGQILLSQATRDLVIDRLPEGIGLADLGVHRLRDLGRAERVFGVVHPDLPAVVVPESLDTRPNNLPVVLSSFIGRERELIDVAAALSWTRLLTLTGAGGCGKTRLAMHAAADTSEHFPDGVWWVELAPLSGPDVVARGLAAALGVRPLPGATELDAVLFYLESRRALVLLDNCEHVLGESVVVAQTLLQGCPGVTVLATSREPLRIAGESDWPVPPLSLPGADGLGKSDAAALFIDRAGKVRPNFTVTDANAGVLARVCRELDGMPLALELAAARVRMMSLEQIAAGLVDRFRLLSGGSRGSLPRHQTLRASVEWSHDLLTPAERLVFRRLAVFAGGFTLDAAERACAGDGLEPEQVLDLLASLVEKSLVQTDDLDPAAVRYRLLETVRQYAFEQLSAAGELASARDRHRDTYLHLARSLNERMYSASQAAVLAAFDADATNLAAAIQWAAATDPEKALGLCDILTLWWRHRTLYTQAAAAYALAHEATQGTVSTMRTRVTVARAFLLTQTGGYDLATELAAEALAAAENAGDRGLSAVALWALANAAIPFNDGAVLAAAERGAKLALEAGDPFGWRVNAWHVGWVHCVREEGAQLERLMAEVLRECERAHDRWVAMHATMLLAVPPYARGDHAGARRLLASAIRMARDLGDLNCEVMSMGYLGLYDVGATSVDSTTLDELLAVRVRALHAGVASTLGVLDLGIAVATARTGRLEQAGERLQALVDQPVVPPYIRAWTAVELAEIKRLTGDIRGARVAAGAALELANRLPNPWLEARACHVLGRLAEADSDWSAAERHQREALDAITEGGFLLERPAVLEALAHVAAGLESLEEAARLLGAATRARADLGFVTWPGQREETEALTTSIREGLGNARFDAAFAQGAQLAPDEAVAWVRRTRGSRKRPSGGWESLTPTESDVVRHAAEGLTNAEIAARMFIAPGTVKAHLGHIYPKLGVRNRAELTRTAARRLEPKEISSCPRTP